MITLEVDEAEDRADDSYEEACHDLGERMLTEDHPAGTQYACEDEHQTEPPHGIETEQLSKHKQRSCHTTYCCRMRGNLPPHVDQGTRHLDKQRCREDGTHKMRDVYQIHQVDAEEIAEDGDDVWHHTTLLMTEFDKTPPLITAIEMDEHRRQENGEHIHQREHLQLIRPRHQREVTEGKQCHQSH